MTDVVT